MMEQREHEVRRLSAELMAAIAEADTLERERDAALQARLEAAGVEWVPWCERLRSRLTGRSASRKAFEKQPGLILAWLEGTS